MTAKDAKLDMKYTPKHVANYDFFPWSKMPLQTDADLLVCGIIEVREDYEDLSISFHDLGIPHLVLEKCVCDSPQIPNNGRHFWRFCQTINIRALHTFMFVTVDDQCVEYQVFMKSAFVDPTLRPFLKEEPLLVPASYYRNLQQMWPCIVVDMSYFEPFRCAIEGKRFVQHSPSGPVLAPDIGTGHINGFQIPDSGKLYKCSLCRDFKIFEMTKDWGYFLKQMGEEFIDVGFVDLNDWNVAIQVVRIK